MKNLIIIGAGGFGREVLAIALDIQEQKKDTPWRVKGFITDIPGDFHEKDTLGYTILGDIKNHIVSSDNVYAFAIANISFKMKTTRDFLSQGAEFVTLIHPTAVIGRTVEIGIGSIISPRVTVTANVSVGSFVRIGGGTSVGHDVNIGDYSTISGTCGINGYAKIGKGAFLASHVVICPHAEVGNFASVGAGSVVLRKVKDDTHVFGVPAKKINL